MKNKKFVGTVMVPAMLHMFVFIVIPIVIGLVISFFNYNPLSSDNKFIGLENFVRLVQDADFRKALLNTLLFVLITVTLNIGIALVVAQMISWFKSNKVRSFFRMVFFLPCIAPMVATSVVFARSIFPTTTGFLNVALNKIGIDSINWLGDPKVVMISLIIYTIHFQMFAQFAVLILKDGPQNSGLVLSRYIYKMAFEYKDMGYASAVSLVLFVIIMTLSLIEQKKSAVDWEY